MGVIAEKAGTAAIGMLDNVGTAAIQNSMNRRLIAEQNEYNSPVAQMERFKSAGLNPSLIYGHGSAANGNQPNAGQAKVQSGGALQGVMANANIGLIKQQQAAAAAQASSFSEDARGKKIANDIMDQLKEVKIHEMGAQAAQGWVNGVMAVNDAKNKGFYLPANMLENARSHGVVPGASTPAGRDYTGEMFRMAFEGQGVTLGNLKKQGDYLDESIRRSMQERAESESRILVQAEDIKVKKALKSLTDARTRLTSGEIHLIAGRSANLTQQTNKLISDMEVNGVTKSNIESMIELRDGLQAELIQTEINTAKHRIIQGYIHNLTELINAGTGAMKGMRTPPTPSPPQRPMTTHKSRTSDGRGGWTESYDYDYY